MLRDCFAPSGPAMTRKVKRYLIIFIITFAVLGIIARAFPATNALVGKCYQADVMVDISGKPKLEA